MHVGKLLAKDLADGLLVLGVAVGVKECDGDRLDPHSGDLAGQRAHRFLVERPQRTVRRHSLRGAETQLVGGQRRRPGRAQAVELGPVLAPQGDQIGEAFGGHERRPGHSAFEQRVGRHGRAVGEALYLPWRATGLLERRLHRRHHPTRLVRGRGGRLGGEDLAA